MSRAMASYTEPSGFIVWAISSRKRSRGSSEKWPKNSRLKCAGSAAPGGTRIGRYFGSTVITASSSAAKMKADGSVYEAMARDIYGMGYYLAHYKYRFLRLSYLFFLGGFFFAALVEAVHLLG